MPVDVNLAIIMPPDLCNSGQIAEISQNYLCHRHFIIHRPGFGYIAGLRLRQGRKYLIFFIISYYSFILFIIYFYLIIFKVIFHLYYSIKFSLLKPRNLIVSFFYLLTANLTLLTNNFLPIL